MTSDDDLDALLDELSAQGDELDSAESAAGGDEIEPAYSNVGAWMVEWLLPTVERRYAEGSRSGIYWCPRWWAHPEALQRIYSLWREWEKARLDDAMSVWWRDHLDPHLAVLGGENGAFVRCSPERHYEPSRLPAEPLPDAILALMPEGEGTGDPSFDDGAAAALPALPS
ncbi:DUF4913 domain-containing protein [Catellatospora sp. NPDC049133]|uniref:DUF4913 domain-containing protein n=1 Tax=Catellatospora sp. NPDC049133 TaxID=3155499 RepID=UPI0033F1720A